MYRVAHKGWDTKDTWILKYDDLKFKLNLLPGIWAFNGVFHDLAKRETSLYWQGIMNKRKQSHPLWVTLYTVQCTVYILNAGNFSGLNLGDLCTFHEECSFKDSNSYCIQVYSLHIHNGWIYKDERRRMDHELGS